MLTAPATRAGAGPRPAVPRWAGALVALQIAALVVLGGVTVARFHVWAPVDERQHYDYVQTIAEQHRLPLLDDLVSPEVQAITDRTWPRPAITDPRTLGLAGRSYEAFQPPLYYLLAAPVFAAVPDHRDKLTALRALDLALVLVAAFLLWRIALRVAPRAPLLALAAALTVLLWPGVLVRAITVSNAPLELVLATALLLVLWRLLERGGRGPALAAGVLLGACVLTKSTLIYLVPLVLVVLALDWRARRDTPAVVVALVLPALMLAPWLAFNLDHYDALTASKAARDQQQSVVNPAGITTGPARRRADAQPVQGRAAGRVDRPARRRLGPRGRDRARGGALRRRAGAARGGAGAAPALDADLVLRAAGRLRLRAAADGDPERELADPEPALPLSRAARAGDRRRGRLRGALAGGLVDGGRVLRAARPALDRHGRGVLLHGHRRPAGHLMDDRDELLAEQVRFYRAVAGEYHRHGLDVAGGRELEAALDAFRPAGSVLELACGPGTWTARLLRHADSLTAVDAAPEMLALARRRVGDDPRVRFVAADLFDWEPDGRYDVVAFGFWLSHVPPERFDGFWELVGRCLAPGGRVFFADDGLRTPAELVEGPGSVTIERRLLDGTAHRAVKVPLAPAPLEAALRARGWAIAVTATTGPFFWGAGGRA